jgi:protein-S-isoprenylcysteine O-methyltransferase Ste14
LFFASFGPWVAWELALQIRTKEGEDRTRRAEFYGTTLGLILAFPAAGVHDRLPGPGWVAVGVGLVLLWAGWLYRAWAVRTLGRFFRVTVVVDEDQRVVDTGPYRMLRHPSYTGMLVTLVGVGTALDSWLSIAAAFLPGLIAILRRIGEEEGVLLRELGEPYRDYARRTRHRLLPGVW